MQDQSIRKITTRLLTGHQCFCERVNQNFICSPCVLADWFTTHNTTTMPKHFAAIDPDLILAWPALDAPSEIYSRSVSWMNAGFY